MSNPEPKIESIPQSLSERMLRAHLRDEAATLTRFELSPMSHDGMWANLARAQVEWTGEADGSARWIVKRWKSGSFTEIWLGVREPLEAMAWEQGLIRRDALPEGFHVPFIGAESASDKQTAWILMEDVSAEIETYKVPNQWAPAEIRSPVYPPDETLRRTKLVLDRLARFHALWERPERQKQLEACAWLTPTEMAMNGMLTLYRVGFGKEPQGSRPSADWLRLNATAFLTRVAQQDRPMWESFLFDRTPIIAALEAFPSTLLHGDLDTRNIGLRGHDDAAVLVLIDWECMGIGPAAVDVAKLVYHTFAISKGAWVDELAAHYFDCYAAHGGTRLTESDWTRSFNLALAGHGVTWFPSHAGRNVREEGASLEWVDRSIERVTEAMKTVPV